VDGLDWERPDIEQVKLFHKTVDAGNAPRVTLRMEKGHDIDAACGQLRLKEIKK
jgi:23S rRNA (adenine2503-C2)-methyltransferase